LRTIDPEISRMLVDLVFDEIEGSDFNKRPKETWRIGSDFKTMPRVRAELAGRLNRVQRFLNHDRI
jgi:hypothetical protein